MPPVIPSLPLQWGLVGVLLSVLLYVVYALFKGKIVPRSVVEDVRRDRDERLAESLQIIGLWKDAAEKRDQALLELTPMLRELAENGRTVVALVEALKQAVGHQSVGGHDGP